MRDWDKSRCRLLIETARFLFPDTINVVPIVMSALNGRANPAEVHAWIEDDCPPGRVCNLCQSYYDECNCAKTGRR